MRGKRFRRGLIGLAAGVSALLGSTLSLGATTSGYNLQLDLGVQVVENADGTSHVSDKFNLFNGQAPSNTLQNVSDFVVSVDGSQVNASLVPPNQTGVKKTADIVFLMDVSGSMGSHINAVKTNTQAFVDRLTRENFDVQLGLVTFGNPSTPYLRTENSGAFYGDTADFLSRVNQLRANGWHEEWFDSMVVGSQYPFRSGANKVLILITDESGDRKNYDLSTALPVVNANSAKVFSVTNRGNKNAEDAARKTSGSVFDLADPFDKVLDGIAKSIVNSYSVSLLTSVGPGEHTLRVEPVANSVGGSEVKFKIGANPRVALSAATQQMIANGVQPGSSVVVEAEVTDPDGSVASANLLWDDSTGASNNEALTGSGSTYSYTYSGTGMAAVGDCFNFAIQAIDNEGRNTTAPANAGNTVGGKWKICVSNAAPVVANLSPSSYDYGKAVDVTADITDDNGASGLVATLRYRDPAAQNWNNVAMNVASGSQYTAQIPAADAGFGGLEIEVYAQDASQASATASATLTVNQIPVTIVDVTRHVDTLDVGPFSVHAVVAGLDLSLQGAVELDYSVNGTAQTLSMTQAVTGTSSPVAGNSNIYVAQIPAVNAGDKVCYTVRASNPTASESSQEQCFEVLQPAAPLALTPDHALMVVGDSGMEVIASGGYGTYTWSTLYGTLSTTLGDKVTYTPSASGLDKLVVQDIKGMTAVAIIDVLPALSIDPAVDGARFSPSSSVVLNADGGEAPYTWSVTGATSQTSGTDSEQVEITLGSDPATITAVVTDAGGRTSQVTFTNNGTLRVSPDKEIAVALSSETAFAVSGGQPPYSWSTIGGEVDDMAAANVTYTAPALPGTYHVSVADSNGDSATVLVKAGEEMRVTPARARIGRGDAATFEVVAGSGPFTWEVDYGTLSDTTGAKVSYTPEQFLGAYEVRVYDSVGSVKTLNVELMAGELAMAVTPSTAAVNTGASRDFTVTGGSGNYAWTAERGTLSATTGSVVSYTAPTTTGSDTITITDSDNTANSITVAVTVNANTAVTEDLAITPSRATVAPGGSQAFTVINAGSAGVVWTVTAGAISNSGEFTAPASAGSVVVTAVDLVSGRTVTANVDVAATLGVTPASATVNTTGSVTVTVSGGETPYTWRVVGTGVLDNTTGSSVTYTAGNTSGINRLVVLDNRGVTAEVEITVAGSMLITPASATLSAGATQSFNVTGGAAPITWSADEGDVSASGVYTAPQKLGSYLVTATDGSGNKVSATVIVGNVPVISPARAWVDKSGKVTLNVVGGTSPYQWTTTAGSVTENGNRVTYTAPAVSNDVTVTVTDARGQESTAQVYVDLPMQASRETIFIGPQESGQVVVTGGVPPFDWQTGTGEMKEPRTEELGENIYTAPKVMGNDSITIRDQKGNTITVAVNVTRPIAVTPAIRYMQREQSKTFTVVSGVPPYTAIVKSGDGDLSPASSEKGEFTFTSGTTADQEVVLEFSDNSGQTFTAQAWVERTLRTSTTELFVDRNAVVPFGAIGGTGGYTVTASTGFAEIDPDTGKGSYTAPGRFGDATITVVDSKDQEVVINVKVERGQPTVSPSTLVMQPGETRIFMVSRGAGPYDWTFEGALWRGLDNNNSLVELTAPRISGSYELLVEDVNGNTGTANVEVKQPLQLSPSNFVVYRGEKMRITVKANGGAGACDWSLDGLQSLDSGADFITVRPRTDTELGTMNVVTCRDQGGESKSATIILSQLPGDLNGDGRLDRDEMAGVISSHFTSEGVNGVSMDDSTLYRHLDVFSAE